MLCICIYCTSQIFYLANDSHVLSNNLTTKGKEYLLVLGNPPSSVLGSSETEPERHAHSNGQAPNRRLTHTGHLIGCHENTVHATECPENRERKPKPLDHSLRPLTAWLTFVGRARSFDKASSIDFCLFSMGGDMCATFALK